MIDCRLVFLGGLKCNALFLMPKTLKDKFFIVVIMAEYGQDFLKVGSHFGDFLHLTDALLSSTCFFFVWCISMVLPFLFFAGGMNRSHVISDLHVLLDMQIQTDPKMTRQLF